MGEQRMDRDFLRRLSAEMQVALDEVAARHGLTVKVGGGSYDPTVGTFKPKVEFAAAGAERREFERYAALFGLAATDFGRSFTNGGQRFEVVGINPRAPRFPVMARNAKGRMFKFPAETVVALLARASA